MINFGLSILWLGLIYLSRGHLTKQLFRLVNSHGGGHRAFTIIWSLIFLPGTIIHEMSHLFAAAITGTKIGKVEIFPELPRGGIGAQFDQPKKSIHLGYVQTQELGLFRGFLVGTAPLLVGLGLLVWLGTSIDLRFTPARLDSRLTSNRQSLVGQVVHAKSGRIYDLLKIYLFFTISNSLFPSWVDIKHALPLLMIGGILAGGLYFLGIRPEIIPDSRLIMLGETLWKTLMISAGVNLGAIMIMWSANGILRRLRRV